MVEHWATNRSKTRLKLSRMQTILRSLSIYLRGRCARILRICGPSFRIRWFDVSRFLIINKKRKGSWKNRWYIWFIKRKGKKRQLAPDFVRRRSIGNVSEIQTVFQTFCNFISTNRRFDEKPSFFHSRCHEDRDALINGEINSCSNPIFHPSESIASSRGFSIGQKGKIKFLPKLASTLSSEFPSSG